MGKTKANHLNPLSELRRRLDELPEDSNFFDIATVLGKYELWMKIEAERKGHLPAGLLPKPIDRITALQDGSYSCPHSLNHGHKGICTHPLAPSEEMQETRLQTYVEEMVNSSVGDGKIIKIQTCTIEDAKECPFLKVMPLIDFNTINLEEMPTKDK